MTFQYNLQVTTSLGNSRLVTWWIGWLIASQKQSKKYVMACPSSHNATPATPSLSSSATRSRCIKNGRVGYELRLFVRSSTKRCSANVESQVTSTCPDPCCPSHSTMLSPVQDQRKSISKGEEEQQTTIRMSKTYIHACIDNNLNDTRVDLKSHRLGLIPIPIMASLPLHPYMGRPSKSLPRRLSTCLVDSSSDSSGSSLSNGLNTIKKTHTLSINNSDKADNSSLHTLENPVMTLRIQSMGALGKP